jgi:uncharacterized membrane protein YuzA (DUF378 family)
MEIIQTVAIILVVIGAINWGLVGLFKFDLVAFIAGGKSFGEVNPVFRIVYLLVAAAGIVAASTITTLMA